MATICPSCGAANIEGVDECANCHTPLTNLDMPRADSAFEARLMAVPLSDLPLVLARTIGADEPLEAAVALLAESGTDLVNVVEAGKLVGVLSVRDVVMRVGSEYMGRLKSPVREFMTPGPVSLPPSAPITFALNQMDVGDYRHVPIVQDDHLLGVISSRDVLKYVMRNKKQTVVTRDKTQSHGPAET